MKKNLWIVAALLVPVVASWAGPSVTVRKDGTGNYTSIMAAITNGASIITITDSGTYVEDVQIGDPNAGGPPVILTSTKSGDNRPVITPLDGHSYTCSRRGGQQAGFGLFASYSSVSNLIIEANGDMGMSAMAVWATNAVIENCLFRIAPGGIGTLGSSNPLLFFGQAGDGSNSLEGRTPGGADSNGCLVRNCEFIGMAPDSNPVEPTGTGYDADLIPNGSQGYLDERSSQKGTGQNSGWVRVDILTDTGEDVFITFEGCYFHYSRDYGIFPTDLNIGGGSLHIVVKKCRFDAANKFQLRGRGAYVHAEDSVFTRAVQGNNGDDENSAVSIQINDGHNPAGSVKNCLFVNNGSAFAKRAYYGGVNNHNGTLITVDHCTFVDCDTGVGVGHGGGGAALSVTNSIFHQIGDNVPPSVAAAGYTLTNGSPELVSGLYPAWTNGLAVFDAAYKWSAVFNRFQENNSQLIIDNCMVGSVDTEDSRDWYQASVTDNTVLGCRLYAGYATNFVVGTVTRATPVFRNTDPDAPNAFQLAQGSPGQGLGADLAPVLASKLSFSQAGNQLTISWTQPLWVKGVLKSTSTLSNPNWQPAGGETVFGVAHTATVTIGAGNQYFALLKQ